MINYDYQYARERKAKEHRAHKRQSIVLSAGLFVLYLIVSTMSYNDCLQGIC
jgi:hypothetical protein